MTGIDGNYRMTCESVLEVLRDHKDSVMAVLEAFVYDPLLNWRLMDGEQLDLNCRHFIPVDTDVEFRHLVDSQGLLSSICLVLYKSDVLGYQHYLWHNSSVKHNFHNRQSFRSLAIVCSVIQSIEAKNRSGQVCTPLYIVNYLEVVLSMHTVLIMLV